MNSPVLVLNADNSPHTVRNLHRALMLLYKGRVEIVATRPNIHIRSGGKEIECPSIIRLKKYQNVPRRGATWNKNKLFQRDKYTCIFCGKKMEKHEATIDHIFPKSKLKKMGKPYNTWTNTACACRPCQTRKGDKTLAECGMKLLWEPRTPRTNYIVITSEIFPEWKEYLEVK